MDQLVPVINPDGELKDIPSSQQKEAVEQHGYTLATPDDVEKFNMEQKYGGTGEGVKAFIEGAAEAPTFGLSTGVERAFGVKPEAIRARRMVHEGAHAAGQVTGLAASALIPGADEAAAVRAGAEGAEGLGEAALAAKRLEQMKSGAQVAGEAEPALYEAAAPVAEAPKSINPLSAQSVMSGVAKEASKAAGLGGAEAGVLNKIGASSLESAAEMAIFQSGDEISKMISEDPDAGLQTAIPNIGMAALIGGAFGAGLGAVSPLWKASVGQKLGDAIADFKGRINEHLTNPDPASAMVSELDKTWKNAEDHFNDVYGAKGLKAQDIRKVLPEEITPQITEQYEKIADHANNILTEMTDRPEEFTPGIKSKFTRAADRFLRPLREDSSSYDLFDSTDALKKFAADVAYSRPLKSFEDGYSFQQQMKKLSSDLKTSLEDESVWGGAAKRQKEINKAFSEYKPALDDFKSKFTEEVGGERRVSPQKVATFYNQIGKPNADIKKEMLDNFLNATEKYKGVIDKTHENLGIESTWEPSSLSVTKSAIGELSPGAKIADTLIKKGMANLAGHGAGTAIGAGVGHAMGSGMIGALIGEHALGPFFSSVLPSIMKPLLQAQTDSSALKAASTYGMAIVRGQKLVENASKAVFKSGQEVLPTKFLPKEDDRDKLQKQLAALKQDPSKLLNIGGDTSYYLPDHGGAMAKAAGSAVQLLDQLNPKKDKESPLDSKPVMSQYDKARYNRVLDIVQQPLIILQDVKHGEVTSTDIMALRSVYPELYGKLQQSVTNEMIDHIDKGEIIPYKTKLGLSLFLGQPMDSTMTMGSIQSLQATYAPAQPPPPMRAKHSFKDLNKIGNLDVTSQQSREMKRSK